MIPRFESFQNHPVVAPAVGREGGLGEQGGRGGEG